MFFRLSPAPRQLTADDYKGLHDRYARIMEGTPFTSLAKVPDNLGKRLRRKFNKAMKTVFNYKDGSFSVDILGDKDVTSFIEEHAGVLDSSFRQVPMSDSMRQSLSESNYIFSGMKTFHELNEAFPSLIDENGNRKPFERFLNDVQKIHKTYNENYLRAEYSYVCSTAQSAAKWEQIEADGDRYDLQYRTAGDGKVRPAHAAMHNITLPPGDPFWDEFTPPNGWSCRCNYVQVRKGKYPVTPHAEAAERGRCATTGMFRFNPGKQRKSVPDYNPYTISRCDTCSSKLNLAANIPANQLCQGCRIVREMAKPYSEVPGTDGRVRIHRGHGKSEKKENIESATYLSNKYGYEIDLLPKEDRHPDADSFNRTLGVKQEYKVSSTPSQSSIDNLLRKANRQAENVVLFVNSDISTGDLRDIISDRVKRSKKIKSLMIVRNGTDATYTRQQIIAEDFKIKPGDFK